MSEEIQGLRAERALAVESRGIAAGRSARAWSIIQEARRRGVPRGELGDLVRAREEALRALIEARALEHRLLEGISDRIADQADSPIDRIDALDARYPVAFFPVRIETRFQRGPVEGEEWAAGELLLRIYPDGLLVQMHEPLLTDLEVQAGEDYWRRVANGRFESESWTLLLGEADSQRAAWIVERTTPENLETARAHPGVELAFPALETRPPGWHRAPEASTLPDRWIVTVFRGGAVRRRVLSAPVREGLALTLRLSADAEEAGFDEAVDLSGDGLVVEAELRWAYDFYEAVRAGMAVRIPVSAEDLDVGFSTVLVAGLRTTVDAESQAGELEVLFDGHRFSRGFAFVPQGTQTNNSQDAPSGYPPDDPAGTVSFAVTRGAPLAAPGTDGHRFMTALGLDPDTAAHVAGADRDEQTAAGAMADALWPATIGYFLDQLMAPQVEPQTTAALRAHMRNHVRARGPFPAFRVGGVPYGLLPVSALSRWQVKREAGDDPLGAQLSGGLQRLERLWSRLTSDPPHVGRSGDPDTDLVETLAQDASAQAARIRRSLGQDAMWNILMFSAISFESWRDVQRQTAQDIIAALGGPSWDPRVLHLSLAGRAHDFTGPLIQKEPLSETDPLAFDYIAWLRAASPAELREQLTPPTDEPLYALLYLMLRHALLVEYDRSALDLLDWRGLVASEERYEPELVGIAPTAEGIRGPRTAWQRLDVHLAGVTGDRSIGAFLADPKAGEGAPASEVQHAVQGLNDYRASLQALEGLPSSELERLFTETLDACSHRIDPWITGLYADRLETMRQEEPRGVYIGCYGWVEGLVPDPEPERVPIRDRRGVAEQARTDSGGYVYAPSMLHGATAAVLRSAHLTRGDDADGRYAVNLSSRRVRAALELLDSVRNEQPVGAALGYAFERGLHEGHPGVELDRFIDQMRSLYPLVANKAEDSGEPAESVAARNVVDGLRLRAAWTAGDIPWGIAGLTPTAEERAAIEEELSRLDDAVDGIADLLLAESVHQVLRGSPAGAGATLDSLAKGHRPPEPDVALTPRGGRVLHQRVALLVSTETLPAQWDALGPTPRALAGPELNAWLAGLLGAPDEIACQAISEGGARVHVTVADLRFQPIDLLLVAAGADAGAPSADIDRRVARHVARQIGLDTTVEIDYGDAGGARLSFAVALEALSEMAQALGYARPLAPRDLLPPERESVLEEADPMLAEADARATAAENALNGTAAALAAAVGAVMGAPAGTDPDLTALRAALVRAADLGISGAFPTGHNDHSVSAREALLTLAEAVGSALEVRIVAAASETQATERLRAVFGRGYPVLLRFVPAATDVLASALSSEPELGADGDAVVDSWFAGVARVREPLDAWRQVVLYGRALAGQPGRPRIVQLPLETVDGNPRWAALDYEDGNPHRSGLCSLALFGTVPAADASWSGLLLDEWPEILPNLEEDAGVVFHYDAPGAQAPQCVLLAVPPSRTKTWSYDVLEETLLHTLELARIRAVDLTNLGLYGQVLPMAYLAANHANEAIATSFVGLVSGEPTLVRET